MVWLVTHMWLALCIAAFFGLLLGWSFRGLQLKGGARRAIVERDIALTELEQARSELDGLYAAQRTGIDAATSAGDTALRAELELRESKLQDLNSALAASRQELEDLRQLSASGAAAVSATASEETERLDEGIHAPSADLEWRNRYLESRTRTLQEQVSAQGETMAKLTARVEAAETDRLAAISAQEAAEATSASAAEAAAQQDVDAASLDALAAEAEKAKYLNTYLQARISYLEANPIQPREGAEPPADEEDAADQIVEKEDSGDPVANAETGQALADIEQELARLRWRNRYLEGRIAYIDGDVEKGEASAAPMEAGGVTQADEGPGGTAGRSAVDGFLATVESDGALSKPNMIERPDDDGDDLTQIRGIDPAARDALNGFGVWRFSQIAAWSRQNVAWVNDQLGLDGQIDTDGWVQQADVLAGGGGSA